MRLLAAFEHRGTIVTCKGQRGAGEEASPAVDVSAGKKHIAGRTYARVLFQQIHGIPSRVVCRTYCVGRKYGAQTVPLQHGPSRNIDAAVTRGGYFELLLLAEPPPLGAPAHAFFTPDDHGVCILYLTAGPPGQTLWIDYHSSTPPHNSMKKSFSVPITGRRLGR